MTEQLASAVGVTLNKTSKRLHFDILVPTPYLKGLMTVLAPQHHQEDGVWVAMVKAGDAEVNVFATVNACVQRL